MSEETPVVLSAEGGLGRIELNKPRAINALNQEMVDIVNEALVKWQDDDSNKAVLVTGRGERGLCAGGDIKAIHASLIDGTDANLRFFGEEYVMNDRIARFPKPYVAFMNGITMGGGVGISVHGSHRVVTDSTKIGMPETTIGLFPDVGGTYLLSRAPGAVGMYLGLTGLPVGAGTALAAGLADYYIEDAKLEKVAAELGKRPAEAEAVLKEFAAEAPADELDEHREAIDHAFSADSVEEILERLRGLDTEWGTKTADLIQTKSPLSLKVTFESIRTAGDMSLEEVLERDLRTGINLGKHNDLTEGIRAQVIDKDRNPQWKPATLEEVSSELVQEVLTEPAARKVFQ